MQKTKKKRIKPMHIIVILLVVYISVVMLNQRKLMKNLQSKKNSLQSEINVLQKDINDLNYEIENSDSLQFVERIAREELGMLKPREIIYVNTKKLKNSIFDIFQKDKN